MNLKSPSTRSSIDRWDIFILLAHLFFLVYIVLLYMQAHFVDWQELILEPLFILRGLKLYTDIATHHTPLLTEFLAALYRLAGTGIVIRKLLLILVTAATAFLTFRATQRLIGKREGFFALLLFAVFWPFYGGTDFWFDAFLPLFYLSAFLIIIQRDVPGWILLAGGIMGLSFLVKQSGAQVAAIIVIMLLVRAKPIKLRLLDGFVFAAGFLLPLAVFILWYASRGQMGEAYYWIIKYNLSGFYMKFAAKPPTIKELLRLVMAIFPIFLLLIETVLTKSKRRMITWESRLAFYIGFGASLAMFPRWERFHVAPAVPFLVILLVLSFKVLLRKADSPREMRIRRATKIILFIWIAVLLLDIGSFYPPMLAGRIIPRFAEYWPLHSYGPPVWYDEDYAKYIHDIPQIAEYLRDNTSESDRIFVWGWEGSRIYLHLNRLPAGKFYYTLPWFTYLPRFREDLRMSFERDRPQYVVVAKRGRQYPGTPSLSDMGVDLEKMGYFPLSELEERFPKVVIWTLKDT